MPILTSEVRDEDDDDSDEFDAESLVIQSDIKSYCTVAEFNDKSQKVSVGLRIMPKPPSGIVESLNIEQEDKSKTSKSYLDELGIIIRQPIIKSG